MLLLKVRSSGEWKFLVHPVSTRRNPKHEGARGGNVDRFIFVFASEMRTSGARGAFVECTNIWFELSPGKLMVRFVFLSVPS